MVSKVILRTSSARTSSAVHVNEIKSQRDTEITKHFTNSRNWESPILSTYVLQRIVIKYYVIV